MRHLYRFLFLAFLSIFLRGGYAQNPFGNPPGTVDDLLLVEGAANLTHGARLDRVQATADGSGVELAPGELAGSLTLPIYQTRFPYNESIPSWNGWVPPDGGFRVWMEPVLQDRSPTSWFDAGTWGRLPDEITTRILSFPYGMYNIDNLELRKPGIGVAIRFDLVRASASSPSPVIRLFAFSYTNSLGNQKLARQFGSHTPHTVANVDMKVPYFSQVVPKSSWIGRICSPCSINMVLGHFGIHRETQSVAAMVYDQVSDSFGVWHRSVQGAAQLGLRGYVTRFRNWNDVTAMLEKGDLICASIRFEPGEVEDPIRKFGKRKHGTKGHLILIKGITRDGHVITHDTASKDYGVNLEWKEDELAKAWFDKGGVAYVFTGKAGAER